MRSNSNLSAGSLVCCDSLRRFSLVINCKCVARLYQQHEAVALRPSYGVRHAWYSSKPFSSLPLSQLRSGPLLALTSMSHTHPTAASSSSSSSSSPNFQLLINNALDTYKKRTGKDLRTHPLTVELETCDSPDSILAVLQQQFQGLDRSWSTDERWTKWLDPTINVLYTFSNIVGAGVGLVCFITYTYLRSAFSNLCGRYSPLRASSSPELGSSFQCVSFSTLRGPS